jgi:hypothetical protein
MGKIRSVEHPPHLFDEQSLVTRFAEAGWWRECSASHTHALGQTDTQALVAQQLNVSFLVVSHPTMRHGYTVGRPFVWLI